jgi:N-acetylmuramoyl-L-alanine amidase
MGWTSLDTTTSRHYNYGSYAAHWITRKVFLETPCESKPWILSLLCETKTDLVSNIKIGLDKHVNSVFGVSIPWGIACKICRCSLMSRQSKKRRSIDLHAITLILLMVVLLTAAPAQAQTYVFNTHTARLTSVQMVKRTAHAERQLICMSLNIYHEARGSTEANQLAVGLVTWNRHKRTGKSICDIVYESRGRNPQFSWTNQARLKNRKLEKRAWDRAQRIAHRVIYEQPRDITRGAHHFHEKTMTPYWSRQACERVVIGAHVFVKLAEVTDARAVVLP